jgi:hypothetical protein
MTKQIRFQTTAMLVHTAAAIPNRSPSVCGATVTTGGGGVGGGTGVGGLLVVGASLPGAAVVPVVVPGAAVVVAGAAVVVSGADVVVAGAAVEVSVVGAEVGVCPFALKERIARAMVKRTNECRAIPKGRR